jgi:hypothetical protein
VGLNPSCNNALVVQCRLFIAACKTPLRGVASTILKKGFGCPIQWQRECGTLSEIICMIKAVNSILPNIKLRE